MSTQESMEIDPPSSPPPQPPTVEAADPTTTAAATSTTTQQSISNSDKTIGGSSSEGGVVSTVVSTATNNSGLTVEFGRDVEISNSYELSFNMIDGHVIIDKEYFTTKQEQFRQVFPQFDFLGWYTLGPYPLPDHIEIHKQLQEYNESPLFLQMNPQEIVTSKNLPITVYESIIDIIDGQANMLFIKAQYKIETGEAERIAVDHVARASSGDGVEGSSLIAHLTTQGNAIKMLHTRVKMLHRYLVDYKKGELEADHDILRQISSLCNRMPTFEGSEFREEFLTEYNDVLLTSYLATITKGTNSINELVDKFNIATHNQGNRNRRHQSFGW
ncbi:13478_t:CDS:2 [Ambispora gerdemannii]|uniref:COP9 signalosome complex subunit 6 n=1 Tax=Ambispora gerdemannii TaxID=144530 RepID=A0A9N9CVJ9_9GLOM|nr:13478_t:CDS:2 [Ambispora gerdemannii]